ncbi:MAG: hypothetical protein JNL82_27835 [Myxococcales bacterium]|nr:hypothetical protein [Myxococcales bacterium]
MSDLPRQLSIVSYAVNGSGLGHVARQVAIHRWLRRYAAFAGVHTQHWFLTTSEADTWLWHEGFAAFKLPSKSVVEAAGVGKLSYVALAKQWIWHSLALLRPDLLLVDTFPNGSFHELIGALDLCRHKALVLRPVKHELASQPAFRAMVALYDRVVVPEPASEHRGLAERLGLDPRRLACTGPVMARERWERLPRQAARAALGVDDTQHQDIRCVLVSAGGGGDTTAAPLFDRVAELLGDDPGVHLVFAAGPLYRGPARRGPRITWWTGPGLAEQLAGVDAAVTAAGFNTVHELLFAGVPTVFVPQDKIADDQAARVANLVQAGAARVADLHDVESLRVAVAAVLADPEPLRRAGAALVPGNHARDAALEVLGLVLPPAVLRHARDELDDASLADTHTREIPLPTLVDVACALHAPRGDVDRATLELDPALDLLRTASDRGVAPAVVLKLANLVARKLRAPRPAEPEAVAAALTDLVSFPGLADQWSAAALLLGALTGEREWSPRELVRQICDLLDAGLSAGRDVFATARLVVEAQVESGEGGTNAGLLARARARLTANR